MTSSTFERRIAVRLRDLAASPSVGLLESVLAEVGRSTQRRPSLVRISVTRRMLLIAALMLLLAATAGAIALSRIPPDAWPFTNARWTAVRLPFSGSAIWRASPNRIVAFRGGYVAVGGRPGINGWGSRDDVGLIWRQERGGDWQVVDGPQLSGATILGLATDGRRLLAVGLRATGTPTAAAMVAATWISQDGQSWASVMGGPASFAGPIVYHDGRFVAIGGGSPAGPCSCDIWTTSDGAAWTHATFVPEQLTALRATDVGLVAVGGGGWRPGSEGASYISSDGVSWRRAPLHQSSLANLGISEVASADDGLVGIGWYDAIAPATAPGLYAVRSLDGLTWTRGQRIEADVNAAPIGIDRIQSGYVTLLNVRGSVLVMGSRDGSTWSQIATIPILDADGTSVTDWLVDDGGQLVVLGESTHGPLVWTSATEDAR